MKKLLMILAIFSLNFLDKTAHADGHVENRLFKPPPGQTPSSMKEAANFLNALMEGNTLSEAKKLIKNEIDYRRQELDTLARDLVQSGLALL